MCHPLRFNNIWSYFLQVYCFLGFFWGEGFVFVYFMMLYVHLEYSFALSSYDPFMPSGR